jgi:Sulfotransferase family
MYFLVDNTNKLIFGWSAKCGCSHIKKLYQFLANKNEPFVHMQHYYGSPFPQSMDGYTVIIILRNPYERIVSGYLDKYSEGGHYYHWWTSNQRLTYRNFIDEIIKNTFKQIHHHHFTPQLSEDWGKFQALLLNGAKPKEIKVYDLQNIDYGFIENICNRKIPKYVLEYRGDHINKRKEVISTPVYDLTQPEFENKKPKLKCFYDEQIIEKFFNYYKEDFAFANMHGIVYDWK